MTQTATLASGRDAASSQPDLADTLLARTHGLIPYLQGKSDEIAAARRLPEDVMQRLVDAGLMQLLRPKRFGGQDAPMDLMYRISRLLARGDGSVGWVYAVTNSHDQFIGLYPGQVQEEYWASARPLSASSYAPTGKAVPASGGFTLSGKWSFCSGIDYCDWVVLGAVVGMLPGEKPAPDMRYFLVPLSQLTVVDDWHVMGLRGTGSKSVALDDVFVPDERVLTGMEIATGQTPGAMLHDSPTYRAPVWTLFGFCIAAAATGIVQSAYEDIKVEFAGRASRREPPFEAKKPAVQIHLAEASVLLDCSDMLYNRALIETFDQVNRNGTVSMDLRIRNRRDLSYSVLSALRAGEILMGMAGGRGIVETGRVQRALRDVYGVSVHPGMNWDAPALSFGSVELGGGPTEPYY